MSESNSYETLGLDESSSFEEVQEARERLLVEHADDRKRVDAIETAYDAILMERLRLRQEGKIKVPDRIRFAEKAAEPAPEPVQSSLAPQLSSLANWLDTPSRNDIVIPAIAYLVLAVVGLYAASFALAVGVGVNIYFLNRKEHRFWRSILLTLVCLIVGIVLGLAVSQFLIPEGLQAAWAQPDKIAAVITFIVLWAASSFLR